MKYGKVWENQSKSRLLELAGVEEKPAEEESSQDVQGSIECLEQSFKDGDYDKAKAYAEQILKNIEMMKDQS